MNDILQVLQDIGLTLLNHFIEIGIGIALLYLRQWTGIQIEAKHRAALQSAVLNGVRQALTKNLSGNALKHSALDYVLQSVPDAVTSLIGKDYPGFLTKLIEAKEQEVLAEVGIKP